MGCKTWRYFWYNIVILVCKLLLLRVSIGILVTVCCFLNGIQYSLSYKRIVLDLILLRIISSLLLVLLLLEKILNLNNIVPLQ